MNDTINWMVGSPPDKQVNQSQHPALHMLASLISNRLGPWQYVDRRGIKVIMLARHVLCQVEQSLMDQIDFSVWQGADLLLQVLGTEFSVVF